MYDRIKFVCAKRGISVQALEKAAKLSNGSISKWAISTPKADALLRVAEILETSMEYLLTGKERESPAPGEGEAGSNLTKAVIRFIDSLPKDRLRGILLALGAPAEVLASLDQPRPPV